MEKKMKSGLKLNKADMLHCVFGLDEPGFLRGSRSLSIDRNVLPNDYESELYDVTGEVSIVIKVEKKKKGK